MVGQEWLMIMQREQCSGVIVVGKGDILYLSLVLPYNTIKILLKFDTRGGVKIVFFGSNFIL